MEGYRDEKDRQKNRRKEAQRSFVLLSPIDLQRTNQAGQNGRGQQKTQKQAEQKIQHRYDSSDDRSIPIQSVAFSLQHQR